MRTLTLAIACALWSLSGHSQAQAPRDALLGAAGLAPDLELPAEVSHLGTFSAPKMALYKPEGPGPFPAMVILHQCGGLRSSSGTWQNMPKQSLPGCCSTLGPRRPQRGKKRSTGAVRALPRSKEKRTKGTRRLAGRPKIFTFPL